MIVRNELEIAEIKYAARQVYKHGGFEHALQMLSDMLIGARVLAEVMVEEKRKESQNG